MLNEVFAQNLRGYRKGQGMRIKDMARRLEYTESYVMRLEKAPGTIRIGTIERVADKLGLDVFDLLEPGKFQVPSES